MKLIFERTERIEVELPIDSRFHMRDAEAFANEPVGDMTRLEAHAIMKGSNARITPGPWELKGGDGDTTIANPFTALPAPPRPRGRRAGSTAGHNPGDDTTPNNGQEGEG